MSDIRDDKLLWIDLETTGSDPTKDAIIEVGAIATTSDLEVLGDLQLYVRPPDDAFGRMMRNKVVREMHTANGLLDIIVEDDITCAPEVAANAIIEFMFVHECERDRTVLAGSGVGHFDRRFLDRWMPQVSRHLRYWCIDVGVIRRAHEMWTGAPYVTVNGGKNHRALDDAYIHLQEARAFRGLWKHSGVSPAPV